MQTGEGQVQISIRNPNSLRALGWREQAQSQNEGEDFCTHDLPLLLGEQHLNAVCFSQGWRPASASWRPALLGRAGRATLEGLLAPASPVPKASGENSSVYLQTRLHTGTAVVCRGSKSIYLSNVHILNLRQFFNSSVEI